METIKKISLIYILFICLIISCKEKSTINKSIQDKTLVQMDTLHIADNLLKSSNDFVNRNNLSNTNVEVDIDKKEYNQIYITFITRGIADFEVRKFKPMFTYEIKDNLFFVFTGAEELLNIPFDEAKYQNRRQGRYDTILKAWYVFEDDKMRREDSCTFYEPFSNLKPIMPPPPKSE